jgi:hypothetical protein
MQYILMIYGDEQVYMKWSKEQLDACYADHGKYGEALTKAGVLRGGAELMPTTDATSIRFTNGKPKTFDGPFAETKEQLGGYYVIEVENLEQAIEWAEKVPCMDSGTVEVRPLGMGAQSLIS